MKKVLWVACVLGALLTACDEDKKTSLFDLKNKKEEASAVAKIKDEFSLPENFNYLDYLCSPDQQVLDSSKGITDDYSISSVGIFDDYFVIGARGGFLPNVYFKAQKRSEENNVEHWAIQKESEEDPGKIMWAVYSNAGSPEEPIADSVYLDSAGNILMAVGDGADGAAKPAGLKIPDAGQQVQTLGKGSLRSLKPEVASKMIVAPLKAEDLIAKDLNVLHELLNHELLKKSDGSEEIFIVFSIRKDADFNSELKRLKQYRRIASAIKNAGFRHIQLYLQNAPSEVYNFWGEDSSEKAFVETWYKVYRAFDLYMPKADDDRKKFCLVRDARKSNAPEPRGLLKLLYAQTKDASADIYDFMKSQKFSKDIDKVLEDAGLLAKDAGAGGISDGLISLLGADTSKCVGTKVKGFVKPLSESDISIRAGGGSRSKAEILKVVKQRTPGLRHIYNKNLKKKPGFDGRVTLKFTIAPGGEIISISIAFSTTGFREFDNEIKSVVSHWKFGTVKSGNTTVMVPFTFSE